jgi:hypothetical protein
VTGAGRKAEGGLIFQGDVMPSILSCTKSAEGPENRPGMPKGLVNGQAADAGAHGHARAADRLRRHARGATACRRESTLELADRLHAAPQIRAQEIGLATRLAGTAARLRPAVARRRSRRCRRFGRTRGWPRKVGRQAWERG